MGDLDNDEASGDLERTRDQIEQMREDLAQAEARRNRLILHLSRQGLSRRKVAELAGVTAGRVQQIVELAPQLDLKAASTGYDPTGSE